MLCLLESSLETWQLWFGLQLLGLFCKRYLTQSPNFTKILVASRLLGTISKRNLENFLGIFAILEIIPAQRNPPSSFVGIFLQPKKTVFLIVAKVRFIS